MGNLKVELLQNLEKYLEPFGFNLVKSKEWFKKKERDRILFFWIVFYKDLYGFRVAPTLAIRFNQIEEIFHRFSGYEKKYQGDTHTIVTEIWRLKNDRASYEYQLASTEDISSITDELILVFKDCADTYFKKHISLNDIDSLLNNEPNQESIHQIMDYARCSRGAITAKLCHRNDYDEIVSIYRQRMQDQDHGFYLSQFDALLKFLNEY